jgi:hypothetical protein
LYKSSCQYDKRYITMGVEQEYFEQVSSGELGGKLGGAQMTIRGVLNGADSIPLDETHGDHVMAFSTEKLEKQLAELQKMTTADPAQVIEAFAALPELSDISFELPDVELTLEGLQATLKTMVASIQDAMAHNGLERRFGLTAISALVALLAVFVLTLPISAAASNSGEENAGQPTNLAAPREKEHVVDAKKSALPPATAAGKGEGSSSDIQASRGLTNTEPVTTTESITSTQSFTLTKYVSATETVSGTYTLLRKNESITGLVVSVDTRDNETGVPVTVTVEVRAKDGKTFKLGDMSFEDAQALFEPAITSTHTITELIALLPPEFGTVASITNLREEPNVDSKIVGRLLPIVDPTKKEPTRFVALQDGWYQTINGAWVLGELVTEVDPPAGVGGSEVDRRRQALVAALSQETGIDSSLFDLVPSATGAEQELDGTITALVGDRVVATIEFNGDTYVITIGLTGLDIQTLQKDLGEQRQAEVATGTSVTNTVPVAPNVPASAVTAESRPAVAPTTPAPVSVESPVTEQLPKQLIKIERSTLDTMGIPPLPEAVDFYRGPGDTYFGFDQEGRLVGVKSTYEPNWTTGKTSELGVDVFSTNGDIVWNSAGVGQYNENVTVEAVNDLVTKFEVGATQNAEIERLLTLEPTQMLIGAAALILKEGDVLEAQKLAGKYAGVAKTTIVSGWKPDHSGTKQDYSFSGGQNKSERAAFIQNGELYILTGLWQPEDTGVDSVTLLDMIFRALIEELGGANSFNSNQKSIFDALRIPLTYDGNRHLIKGLLGRE